MKEGIEAQLEAVSGSCNHLPRLPDDDDEEDNDEEDDGDDDGDDDDDDDADDNDDDSSREPLTIMITLQIGVSGSARDKLAANYVPSTVVFL